jgi:Protein of unknown function (DUF2812)
VIVIGNVTYRSRFYEYWRIGEQESWFEDMALQGLHLDEIGLIFAKFEKGEPKETKYRIGISPNEDIVQKEKIHYSQRGWKYVTNYRNLNVFSSPYKLNASEFYTDPAEQAYTLKKLSKDFVWAAFINIALIVMFIAMYYSKWFSNTSTLTLIESIDIQPVVLTIYWLYLSINSIKAAVYITNLRRNLERGKPINHNAPWRKQRVLSYGGAIVYLVFLTATLIIPTMSDNIKTLPINSDDLPIVRLADIEKDSNLVRQESLDGDIDWANYYEHNWSIFAPIQYSSYEEGVVSNVYSPSMNTRVYKLRYPSMAEDLISDLIKRFDIEPEDKNLIKLNNKDFDNLIVYESKDFKDVFASKGKGVIHVRYFGYAKTDAIIDSILHKINLISQ